MPYRITDKQVA